MEKNLEIFKKNWSFEKNWSLEKNFKLGNKFEVGKKIGNWGKKFEVGKKIEDLIQTQLELWFFKWFSTFRLGEWVDSGIYCGGHYKKLEIGNLGKKMEIWEKLKNSGKNWNYGKYWKIGNNLQKVWKFWNFFLEIWGKIGHFGKIENSEKKLEIGKKLEVFEN